MKKEKKGAVNRLGQARNRGGLKKKKKDRAPPAMLPGGEERSKGLSSKLFRPLRAAKGRKFGLVRVVRT